VESLALAVTILVSPAMYGGPLAVLLTFWQPSKISKARIIVISLLSFLSLASGTFLVIENISRGGFIVGAVGVICACLALYRVRKLVKQNYK
jgi:succinate-acetate transporter protein